VIWWLLAAVALGAAEFAVSGLVLGMICGGALAATVAAALDAGLIVETSVFTVVSLGLLIFVRPVAQRHLNSGPLLQSGTARLVGVEGVVLESVTATGGRVRLEGEIWSARSYDEAQYPIGATVRVVRIDGATAVVM
jgi:membrane protein implicated in regulation of membrane protease activity